MRKSEFIEYVRSPESLGCEKTIELQQLAREFPWFQTAQILLCRNLKVCENMGFEKQLRIAAAYATDRVRLHQLVMDSSIKENDTEKEISVVKELEEEKKPSQYNRESTLVSQEFKSESAELKETNEHPEMPKSSDEDFLDRQILSHAISNSNLLEGEDKKNTDLLPLEFDEHIKLSEEVMEKNEQIVDFDETEPHSFAEWLKHVNGSGISNEVLEKDENSILEKGTKHKEEPNESKEIQYPPKKKASFYNPTEMAKLSVKEDDDLISETLARIYAQQGNYEKAIKAYKKLSLKYPEKKIYFANQIKTLEENLNP